MDSVVPGLYASAPESLGFGRALEIRAFLLVRESGNVLISRSDRLERDADAVHALGGIARQYLGHRHEASPACDRVAQEFGAPLLVHEAEEPSVSRTCRVAHTFSLRHRVGDDLEVIPTPGHTSGATAYLWDSGEHRCLFTGDSIYVRDGEWVAALLDGVSDRERYIESLELIRGLDYDVLVPSIASAGQPHHAVVERAEAQRRVGAILERLRRGEDH